MLHWKESHYARAAEFVDLITKAVGVESGRNPHPAAIPTPRPLAPASIPKPAAPSAAAVFKNIPWKK